MRTCKYFLCLLSALLLAQSSLWCEIMKGSDGRVTYIGRTEVRDGNVSFDWTGVYLRVRFMGDDLSLKVSDTKRNHYNVWIDKDMDSAPDKVLTVTGADTTMVIFSKEEVRALTGTGRRSKAAVHQVILQKRTEGEQGVTTVKEFHTDGVFLQADPPKDRVIEFIGDSYTCGYGTEASNKERFSPETENQNLTYACMTARYFGADQIVVAHSGMGVARNYNGNVKDYYMPERYLQTFDTVREGNWEPGSIRPDITVIYLGTNDFSTRMQPSERVFVKNYIQLLQEIKDFYGEDHPILCMVPKHDPLQEVYIRKAIDSSGLKKISLVALSSTVHNETGDLGADGHPNGSGHTKIAYTVIPVVSTVTGWEMTGNTVK
ncbi:MAG: hypothetical protein IJK05_09520 [Bacteroidales bacterium]|nr:hypothetical protein [Bacteroidales bacterium]